MTIPEHFYRFLFSMSDFQENIEFDANGNELYRGIAPNTATNTSALWVIAKAIYTPTDVGGSTVYLMTHVSFLRGQIWDNRASISFP